MAGRSLPLCCTLHLTGRDWKGVKTGFALGISARYSLGALLNLAAIPKETQQRQGQFHGLAFAILTLIVERSHVSLGKVKTIFEER